MTLPDFLIVGAPRAGTTSLYRYLQQHPDVFLSDVKEPGYFSPNEGRSVKTLEEYARLFVGGESAKSVGEASVLYLYDHDAPRLIRETLGPEVRILVLLRNPVDLVHSLWAYHRSRGWEDLPFPEALAAQEERLAGVRPLPPGGLPVTHYAYVSRGRYAALLERYFDEFGADRVQVWIFEEFFADPAPAYREVCEFLGVATDHRPDFAALNRSGTPRIPALAKVVNRRAPWKEPLKRLVPLEQRSRIVDRLNRWNRGRSRVPAVGDVERAQLERLFDDDVHALSRLLGRELPWW